MCLISYPFHLSNAPVLRFTGQACSLKKKNLFQALFETQYSRQSIQAHDESGPDTNRRLWTQGLQRETVRAVLLLDLLP
jgi:hypothetical protein